MSNEDRTRDQGGRQPGTETELDEGDNRPDPRRTREQEDERENGRNNPRTPNTQRPDQTPKTA